jgi:hypothetical protein
MAAAMRYSGSGHPKYGCSIEASRRRNHDPHNLLAHRNGHLVSDRVGGRATAERWPWRRPASTLAVLLCSIWIDPWPWHSTNSLFRKPLGNEGSKTPENKEEVRQNWAVPKSLIFGTLGVSGVRDLRAVMCARPIGASAALVSLLKAHAPVYCPSFGL